LRKLSLISRVFAAAAAVLAAALVVGGSYYVGFVGEVQRGLNDPQAGSQLAVAKIAQIEQTLGYQGYLRAYRTFRLTGDIGAREQMTQRSMEASRTLDVLRTLLQGSPAARLALADIAAVVEEFARVARSAPETSSAALRGTASMEAIDAMPQVPQLEATYLTLRTGLERLRTQTSAYQMGSIAWALTWSQMLIICAFATLVLGLIAAAGLLQIGITQPLKLLTWSLRSIGNGRVNQPVWGTDRTDEIGEMARAGEKLRQSLTETEALRELANEGQINIRLEGEASTLLGETISEVVASVNDATDALRRAAEGLQETQAAQQQASARQANDITDVTSKLDTLVTGIDHAHQTLAKAAETRLAHLDTLNGQLGEKGREIGEAFASIKSRTGHAIDGLTTSISAFGNAAASVQSIQGAFFESCDRISSDAATTSETLKSLTDRLAVMLDSAEAFRGAKTAEATGDADTQALVSLFQSEETQSVPAPAATTAPVSQQHLEQLANHLVGRLKPDHTLMQQVEALRDEIRALALRMTEERILMTAEMPAPALSAETSLLSSSPQRTLADIPSGEILERLRRLSDEMATPRATNEDESRGLMENLRAFALRVKPLETASALQDELRDMAPELTEHARTIEETAREVAHAASLRCELESITTELRSLATTIQSGGEAAWTELKDTAMYLGARAETLSAYLSQRQFAETDQPPAPAAARETEAASPADSMAEATQDLATLARIIGTLEQRVAELSDEAVAANLFHQTGGQPTDQPDSERPTGPVPNAEEAIAVVYEAVDRLNNIAAALARAGEANQMRAASNG